MQNENYYLGHKVDYSISQYFNDTIIPSLQVIIMLKCPYTI